MNVICDICGMPFHKKPKAIKDHNFCCIEHYRDWQRRSQINTVCERCGKPLTKSPSGATDRNFCSRSCHMKTLNEELNPLRMIPETRAKLRAAHLNTGSGKSYTKLYGRHEHRVVAERILGRKLKKGEVVHHIDGNKRNNADKNLMVFSSQAEHLEWHLMLDDKYVKEGD